MYTDSQQRCMCWQCNVLTAVSFSTLLETAMQFIRKTLYRTAYLCWRQLFALFQKLTGHITCSQFVSVLFICVPSFSVVFFHFLQLLFHIQEKKDPAVRQPVASIKIMAIFLVRLYDAKHSWNVTAYCTGI